MDDKMALFISTLTDEQKESLKLALGDKEVEPKKTKQPKLRPQSRQPKPTRKERRVAKIRPELDDEYDEPEQVSKKKRRGSGRAQNELGRPCITGPIELNKKFKSFENDPDFNADKHLTKKDLEHWKGKRPPASSRGARVGFAEVTCTRCRHTYEVGIKLAHKNFICDGCITR